MPPKVDWSQFEVIEEPKRAAAPAVDWSQYESCRLRRVTSSATCATRPRKLQTLRASR
jgi:hypothetical protein